MSSGKFVASRRGVLARIACAASVVAIAALTGCANLPATGAGSVDTARLDAFMASVEKDAQAGVVPGAVLLVARDGRIVYAKTVGIQEPGNTRPMPRDAIFRIYSMTKPVVSVAALMLVEEGRMTINDPVSRHLPEFKGLTVGVEKPGADGKPALDRVPARREMTVQDLMRHTSGLTYGIFGRSAVKDAYLKDGVVPGVPGVTYDNAELVRRVAKLPLAHQPGSTWDYSISTDVLGALVEKVAGKTLDVVLAERILRPLKMNDTAFSVPAEKQGRIAQAYRNDPDSKQPVDLLDVRTPPSLLAGGAGLTSTADDYLRFGQMLANGGELDGVRILSRKSVEWMTSDHTDGVRGPIYLPGPGYGFGLGVAVRLVNGVSTLPGSVGDYSWGGYAGTYWWNDPKERLVTVWMMQGPGRSAYFRTPMRTAVYSSLDR